MAKKTKKTPSKNFAKSPKRSPKRPTKKTTPKKTAPKKTKTRARQTGAKVDRFSKNGTGSFAGGGTLSFSFPNQSPNQMLRAQRILKRYAKQMAFWQAAQKWEVNKGRSRARILGYSPVQTKRRQSVAAIKEALANSGVNAAKRQGFNLEYEGKEPRNVSPVAVARVVNGKTQKKKDQRFLLIVWFTGQNGSVLK